MSGLRVTSLAGVALVLAGLLCGCDVARLAFDSVEMGKQ